MISDSEASSPPVGATRGARAIDVGAGDLHLGAEALQHRLPEGESRPHELAERLGGDALLGDGGDELVQRELGAGGELRHALDDLLLGGVDPVQLGRDEPQAVVHELLQRDRLEVARRVERAVEGHALVELVGGHHPVSDPRDGGEDVLRRGGPREKGEKGEGRGGEAEHRGSWVDGVGGYRMRGSQAERPAAASRSPKPSSATESPNRRLGVEARRVLEPARGGKVHLGAVVCAMSRRGLPSERVPRGSRSAAPPEPDQRRVIARSASSVSCEVRSRAMPSGPVEAASQT